MKNVKIKLYVKNKAIGMDDFVNKKNNDLIHSSLAEYLT